MKTNGLVSIKNEKEEIPLNHKRKCNAQQAPVLEQVHKTEAGLNVLTTPTNTLT